MTAAQAVLRCHDITKTIFETLAPGPKLVDKAYTKEKIERRLLQGTLAHAAQTCKALSDPALDVLWREVDDVIQLLSIFPSFVKTSLKNETAYVSLSCLNAMVHNADDWSKVIRKPDQGTRVDAVPDVRPPSASPTR